MNCGCNAPDIGLGIDNACGSGAAILFMTVVNSVIKKQCDVTEICKRVTPMKEPDFEYDFVVIGGGSGGATAAGLLAKEQKWKVLLIEAGGDEPPGSQVPSMVVAYHGNPEMDWVYKTESEPIAFRDQPERKSTLTMGRVLGGSSTINGMIYVRGTRKDYDNWAAAGNIGWGYNDVLPYFKKSEGNTGIGTLVDEKYHGRNGPMTTGRFPDQPEMVHDILKAAGELGYPLNNDLDGDQETGFAIMQTNTKYEFSFI